MIVKHYFPSLIAFGLAVFCLLFHHFAVALIVVGLVAFGLSYAIWVSRVLQDRLERDRSAKRGPGFREVTALMVLGRKGPPAR